MAPFSRAGWEPGVGYSQSVDLRIGVGPGDGDESASRLALRLRGKLETLVSEVRGSEVRVRFRLVEPKLDAGKHVIPADVTRAFAAPFFVDYDARGRALRLHATPGLDRTVSGILRELVASLQLSTPEPATRRWTAVETDTMGDYSASYQASGTARVLRQKTGYVRVAANADDEARRPRPEILAYAAEFQLDDWGRVKALKCTNRMKTTAGDLGIAFDSAAELTIETLSRSRDATGLPLSIAGLVAVPIASDGPVAQDSASMDRELVAGTDVNTLLRDLGGAKDEGETASRVRHRLSVLFRLDKKTIPVALSKLDAANAAEILGGLGAAGTPEAEKALRDVLRDARKTPAERLAAVDGAFALEHPSPDTAAALEELTRSDDPELKQNASLALGVAAARLAEDDASAAEGVVSRLSSDYASAKSSDDRIRVVGALGNARSSDALPALTRAMASDDPAVRTAAAAALRFVPDSAADVLLAQAITSDPELSVRNAALMAAGYRAFDPLEQALRTAARDPEANLRGALVSTLTQMAAHDSQALVLLDWMATNDPSSEVRAKAQSALART
ncbi:MAG TPA: HEAT repeat domain-containing protein [Polyangiaceae bacterium]